MPDFDHAGFLKAWFPSLAQTREPATFFWALNEFLCTTPAGKRSVLDDKLLLSGALAAGGVRTPRILLTLSGGRFRAPDRGELDKAAALRLLDGRDAFIKTRTGWGGSGAFRLHADGSVHGADGARIRRGLARVLKKVGGADYLVQEAVVQDPRYAAVAPASVNTVRCITLPDGDGGPCVVGATWRMGNGKAVVDNASSGGMFCGIDPETGVILGPARTLDGETFETHPASGFRFEGARLPDIRDLFDTARAAHRLLGTSMSVGWDMAMTPQGPLIIEGNGTWMPELHTLVDEGFAHRPWRAFLGGREIRGQGFPPGRGRARRHDMIRATLAITGKVQGVGYRRWVSVHAAERGVEAVAKNLEDGSVRCRLTGQRWRIEFVTLACHRGPPAAAVERVEVREVKGLR